MEKTTLTKIIELAKGRPMILYGDNMMEYFLNVPDSFFVIDDTCVYIFRSNSYTGVPGMSQAESPMEIMCCEFDMIQHVKVFANIETAKAFLEGKTVPNGMTQGTMDETKKKIFEHDMWKVNSPRGYSANVNTLQPYGKFLGSAVAVGKGNVEQLDRMVTAWEESQKED